LKKFDTFEEDDIKAGYLLELDDGRLCLVNYNNRDLLGACTKDGMFLDICNFDENLYSDWRKVKVNKIYGRTFNGTINTYSTSDRNLLWERNEYEIGDRFIIDHIGVNENIDNCIKHTEYQNVKAAITHIYNYSIDEINEKDVTIYHLCFDGHSIMVKKDYLDKCKRFQ